MIQSDGSASMKLSVHPLGDAMKYVKGEETKH